MPEACAKLIIERCLARPSRLTRVSCQPRQTRTDVPRPTAVVLACKAPAIVARVPGHQRILVVSTTAGEADLLRIRDDIGRGPVVLTAPTAEAKRVVRVLEVEPQVEMLLAPVSYPHADRGHRLDELVRRHAVHDRFRDVLVIADSATLTLLLRALAPDQLSTRGAVTVVGLARGDRPVAVRRAVAVGLVLGLAAGVAEPLAAILAVPGAVTLVGLTLLLVLPWRHLGRELLLAAAIAIAVIVAVVAGSARFPGGW